MYSVILRASAMYKDRLRTYIGTPGVRMHVIPRSAVCAPPIQSLPIINIKHLLHIRFIGGRIVPQNNLHCQHRHALPNLLSTTYLHFPGSPPLTSPRHTVRPIASRGSVLYLFMYSVILRASAMYKDRLRTYIGM